MVTARAFVAGLLVALLLAGGITIAVNLVDGALAGVILTAGLIALLPYPEDPEPDVWWLVPPDPDDTDDVWWAEEWQEPLMPYRLAPAPQPDRRPGATPHERRPRAAERKLGGAKR